MRFGGELLEMLNNRLASVVVESFERYTGTKSGVLRFERLNVVDNENPTRAVYEITTRDGLPHSLVIGINPIEAECDRIITAFHSEEQMRQTMIERGLDPEKSMAMLPIIRAGRAAVVGLV